MTNSLVRAFAAAPQRLLAITALTAVVLSMVEGEGAAASQLPDGRAYELVSPAEKHGGFVNEFKIFSSPSGDAVAYASPFAFVGEPTSYLFYNAYAASRTATGWSTVPLNPAQGPNDVDPSGSPPTLELQTFLGGDPLQPIFDTTFGLNPSDVDGNLIDVYARNPSSGAFTWDSSPEAGVKTTPTSAFFAGASSTGSLIAWQATTPLATNDTHEFGEELYATTAGHTELVGILPGNIVPKCGAMFADGINSEEANSIEGLNAFGGETRNAISPDGHQIIFSSPDWGISQTHLLGKLPGEPDPSCAVPRQVYARINGTTTIQISAPQRAVPDPNGEQSADYMGASADGSRIFLISSQELTNDDTTHAPELYEYNMTSGVLTRISAGNSGVAEGNVDGIAGISSDGEHIYFAAHGEPLAPGATSGEEAMYLYEHGHTTLVSMVPDAERDLSHPQSIFGGGPAQRNTDSTPSGGVLVFVSGENLTGEDQTHRAELYRYSALDASLICVSCNRTTAKPVGEVAFPVSEQAFNSPAINVMNESGSEVFFQTNDGLVPLDGNHRADVYEWEAAGSGSCTATSTEYSASLAGCQYLISDGRDTADATLGDVSPDGANVFFTTWDSLTQEDRDLNRDVYDARIGGGFSRPETSVPCSADGCQGPASQGPSRIVPGSGVQSAGENVPAGTTPIAHPKLSRGQLLARALRACARRPKRVRARCVAAAHRKYRAQRHAKQTRRGAARKGQA